MDKPEPKVDNVLLAKMLIAAARCAFGATQGSPPTAEYGWGEMCVYAEEAGLDVVPFTWDKVLAARRRAQAAAGDKADMRRRWEAEETNA
mgnify:CR=1 FL=1